MLEGRTGPLPLMAAFAAPLRLRSLKLMIPDLRCPPCCGARDDGSLIAGSDFPMTVFAAHTKERRECMAGILGRCQ